jgi:hypothetical protein
MAPLAIALRVAGGLALPYIMEMIGKKILPGAATRVDSAHLANQTKLGNLKGFKASRFAGGLRGLGAPIAAVGTAGKYALPLILGGLGRGIQGASVGAGALLGGMANTIASPEQRKVYGDTPGIAAATGSGIGVSAIGNAAGSSINDAANLMRLNELQNTLHSRMLTQADEIKSLNLKAHEADLLRSATYLQGIRK